MMKEKNHGEARNMKIVRWMGVFLGTLLLSALLAGGALAAEGEIQVTP